MRDFVAFSRLQFFSESDFLYLHVQKEVKICRPPKFATMGRGPCGHPLNPALNLACLIRLPAKAGTE